MSEMGEPALGAGLTRFNLVVSLTETHGGSTGAKTQGDGFVPMGWLPSGLAHALDAC